MAFLTVAIIVGAALALFAAVVALGAGLRLKRSWAALEAEVGSEVVRLANRASELEGSVAALQARAEELPIRVAELQHNLATLGVLAGALGTSLRQAQKVLSSAGLKSTIAQPSDRPSKASRSSRP